MMNPEDRSETSAVATDPSLGGVHSGGAGGGEVPDLLPVLPLRNTVLFPGTMNPITVGRAESLQMIDENLPDNRVFGVFTQRDPKVDAPGGDDLFRVGVSANIAKLQRDDSGGVILLVQALQRISIREISQHFLALTPGIPAEAGHALVSTRDPSALTDFLASNLSIELDQRQRLLEELDVAKRTSILQEILDRDHFGLEKVKTHLIEYLALRKLNPKEKGPLLDRMEVIEIAGYTVREKLQIAKRYAVPRQLEENGIDARQCCWTDAGLLAVIENYTREAGVRNLERMIGGVCRHVAAAVARDPDHAEEITPEKVAEILGVARFLRESKLRASEPGVVTGLAYTPSGGEILHIEAIRYPGSGRITLTGQLGDVMKESVQAAHSLVKSCGRRIGIDPEMFSSWDIHVHVPAGAVPKDGPSAGIAMFTVLASLLSDRPVCKDTAMTGELSLCGLVLPIGGLKEKSLAALSAGIGRILIPQGNLRDVAELPEEVREKLEIVPVETADDVLGLVLPGGLVAAAADSDAGEAREVANLEQS